jgi:hypothetical protein
MFFQYNVSWENYKPIRKESMRFKRIWVHRYFFQSKIVLDIPHRVEDVDKTKTRGGKCRFEREGHDSLNKLIGRLVTLKVTIQNPGLIN